MVQMPRLFQKHFSCLILSKGFDNIIIFYFLWKFGFTSQSDKIHHTGLTAGCSQIIISLQIHSGWNCEQILRQIHTFGKHSSSLNRKFCLAGVVEAISLF